MSGPSSYARPGAMVIGAGFIGTAVAEAFLAAGVDVTVVNRSPLNDRRAERLGDARIVIGDAGDAAVLEGALDDVGTVVFSAGAPTPAIGSEHAEDAMRLVLAPLVAVLDALTRRPGVRLLYLSSGGTVYGEPEVEPVPEDHPLRPGSVYARVNVEAERRLETYRTQHGVATTALRCANPYGPGQPGDRGQGLIGTLLWSDGAVPMYGDGSAVRDYIHVDDAAAVIVALAAHDGDLPPVINVGTGVGTSSAEIVSLVEKITQRTIPVRYEPPRSTDLRRVVLDVGLLRSLVDFDPVPIEQGIEATYVRNVAASLGG